MSGVLLAIWLRGIDALAGRTIYALAAVGLALLVGAAGGVVIDQCFFRRVKRVNGWFVFFLFLLALCLLFQLMVLPGIASGWQRLVTDLSRSFSQYLVTLGKTVAVLVAFPAALMALLMMLSMSLAGLSMNKAEQTRGQRMTLFLLLGVVPAVIAFSFTQQMLIPWFGAEALLRMAVLWFGALAALAWWERGVLSFLPFISVLILLLVFRPAVAGSLLTQNIFSRLVHRDSGFAQGAPVYVQHTCHHTVATYTDDDYGMVFTLDGRPLLFGNRFHTVRTLNAMIPLLLRPDCQKAAVCGPEAGLAIPFLLRAGVREVAVAGSDLAVVKQALAADRQVTDGLTNTLPHAFARVRFSSRSAYELILLTGEPTWLRGTHDMYGKRLFKKCRSALADNGLVALHLDARAMTRGYFKTIATRFCQVFPHVNLWQIGPNDWVLIGGKQKPKASLSAMVAFMDRPLVLRDFVRTGLFALPEVLACWTCDGVTLMAALDAVKATTAMSEAWHAPQMIFKADAEQLRPASLAKTRQQPLAWISPGESEKAVYISLLDKTDTFLAARGQIIEAFKQRDAGAGEAGLRAARKAAAVNPRDALLIHFRETLELEGRRRLSIGDFKGGRHCYENLLSLGGAQARAYYGLAYCQRAIGETEVAYQNFERAVAMAPGLLEYRLEFAQAALAVGAFAVADQQYETVLKQEPNHPEVLFRYAKALTQAERPKRDFKKALPMAERACVLTHWQNTTYAYGLADLYMDAGRVLEGMGLKKRLKEGMPLPPDARKHAKTKRAKEHS